MISAIDKATNIVKNETKIHPLTMTPGPPVASPYENKVVILQSRPAREPIASSTRLEPVSLLNFLPCAHGDNGE